MRKNSNQKHKRAGYPLSTATRALLIGVAVIVVCIVCSLALYMSKQGKEAINSGTSQYSKMLEDYQDLDKAMYDGLEVSGQEVVALIKRLEAKEEYVAVRVKTRASKDYVCYNYSYNPEDKSIQKPAEDPTPSDAFRPSSLRDAMENKELAEYINPKASFLGSVWKDKNGVIICIDFKQQ